MGADIGGPALEIAIALAFVFFLLSTLVSAITEGVAWITKQRAKQLEQGLMGMLGENTFADDLFKHALVQSDARKAEKKKGRGKESKKQPPSYVSARNFSLALIDMLGKRGESSTDPLKNVKNGVKELHRVGAKDKKDDDPKDTAALEAQLEALLGDPAVTDLKDFRKAAEGWFDDAMDRVSGWYKRWAQRITCGIAIAVTIVLNVNAVKITETLANEPTVRAAVVAQAESSREPDGTAAGEGAETAVKELKSLKLPILWNKSTKDFNASLIIGWLITAIAISLGSPFWFDALSKLARLRTTGKKPKPEPEPEPLVVVTPPAPSAPKSGAPA
jgi:hypothetical protein